MSTSSFDLRHFHHKPDFIYLCQRCFGILTEPPKSLGNGREIAQCPVCEADYDSGERYTNTSLYLTHRGLRIEYGSDITYFKKLAKIAEFANTHIRDPRNQDYPPLRALYDALLSAKHFVHFASFNLHQSILGALELVSHNGIKVRGVLTMPNTNSIYYDSICEQINEDKYCHPNLEIRYERERNFVHQKFVVIDGLLMFSGSSNLTRHGLQKPNNFLEDLEIITDFDKVREKHNRLFSQPWIMYDNLNSIRMDTGEIYYYDFNASYRPAASGNYPQDMDDIPF